MSDVATGLALILGAIGLVAAVCVPLAVARRVRANALRQMSAQRRRRVRALDACAAGTFLVTVILAFRAPDMGFAIAVGGAVVGVVAITVLFSRIVRRRD